MSGVGDRLRCQSAAHSDWAYHVTLELTSQAQTSLTRESYTRSERISATELYKRLETIALIIQVVVKLVGQGRIKSLETSHLVRNIQTKWGTCSFRILQIEQYPKAHQRVTLLDKGIQPEISLVSHVGIDSFHSFRVFLKE